MNKKGFAISIILYSMIILIVGTLYLLLGVVRNRYNVNNRLKNDVVDSVNHPTTLWYRYRECWTCNSCPNAGCASPNPGVCRCFSNATPPVLNTTPALEAGECPNMCLGIWGANMGEYSFSQGTCNAYSSDCEACGCAEWREWSIWRSYDENASNTIPSPSLQVEIVSEIPS